MRRPLRALKVAPSSEVFIDDVHFVTPELRDGACVAQDIAAPVKGLCGVSVRFATEGRKSEFVHLTFGHRPPGTDADNQAYKDPCGLGLLQKL